MRSFPLRTASYLSNAAHCANVAVAAYSHKDHLLVQHWPHRRWFEVGSEQGLVVWNDTNVVIAIAGTNDAYDMLANFDVRWMRVGNHHVHAGFHLQCQVVASALASLDLPAFSDRSRNWWVTGHSAGAAKASILPLLIPALQPTKIFTFASPRCFRTTTAKQYSYALHRFDHPNDLIPDLPLHGRLGLLKRLAGWSHVGQPTYVWPDGRIDTENGHRLKRIMRHVWLAKSINPARVAKAAVADHSMENVYWRALQPWKSPRRKSGAGV